MLKAGIQSFNPYKRTVASQTRFTHNSTGNEITQDNDNEVYKISLKNERIDTNSVALTDKYSNRRS